MEKRLKVLHVIPDLRKGGAERLAIDLCHGLQTYFNMDCCLVALKPANEYPELTKAINVKVIPARVIPSITGKGISEIKEFDEFVEHFQPDVIHSHLFEAELVVHHRTHPNILYVSHLHDNMFQIKKAKLADCFNKKRLTELYERRLILGKYSNCKKKFIAISRDVDDYFQQNLPSALRKNIRLINNGFFYNSFENQHERKSCGNPLKLLSIGSLVNKKNQAYLIPVVKDLKARGMDVELNLLGDGPNRKMIQELILSEGLENQIHLRGNVNNVKDYLLASDIYLHPATYEPFGLALLEAMASGLPVVSLNGRGNKDIIMHKENGFVFEKEERDQFIETILMLSKDSTTYQKISLEGKKRSKAFDMPVYIEKIKSLYLERN